MPASSQPARQVTSIVAVSSTNVVSVSHESVPFREELFSAANLATPDMVAKALQKMQRHVAEATQAPRSLPVLGGCYFPNVSLASGVPAIIAHRVQTLNTGPVVFIPVRPNAPAHVWEVAQNPANGTITVESDVNVIVDLWFFPAPIAGLNSGIRGTPAPQGASCCLNIVAAVALSGGGLSLTGVPNTRYLVDCSLGPVTIAMPSLGFKQGFAVKHIAGNPATHNVTVNAPGGVGLSAPPPNNTGATITTISMTTLEDFETSWSWWNFNAGGAGALYNYD